MKTDQIITQKQWEKIRRAESEAPAEMVTTPGLSAVPSLASAGWLDALIERWERRLSELAMLESKIGRANYIRLHLCLQDLKQNRRAGAESASNAADVRPAPAPQPSEENRT